MMKKMISLVFAALFVKGAIAQTLNANIEASLRKAKQGDIVILDGFLEPNFKKIPYKQTIVPSPQFIISDDPEYIRVPEAIAMQEEVQPGAVRLYVYNVNGVKIQ